MPPSLWALCTAAELTETRPACSSLGPAASLALSLKAEKPHPSPVLGLLCGPRVHICFLFPVHKAGPKSTFCDDHEC